MNDLVPYREPEIIDAEVLGSSTDAAPRIRPWLWRVFIGLLSFQGIVFAVGIIRTNDKNGAEDAFYSQE